jgi:uncharacterized tellurite resistance protein B-like protein
VIVLADSPELAVEQLRAIILYLTTLAWADGEYHEQERTFVYHRIQKLVAHNVHYRRRNQSAAEKAAIIEAQTYHFKKIAAELDRDVQAMFDEAVVKKEGREAHVRDKLELRCFEVLRSFDPEARRLLLESCDELILADGVEHPAEKRLRTELVKLLAVPAEDEQAAAALPPLAIKVAPATTLTPRVANHDFFTALERPYPTDPGPLRKEAEADRKLVRQALAVLARQRKAGADQLQGKITVDELGRKPFLDGFVYFLPPEKNVEVVVLGDLHGCYSCLKAALLQCDFFGKLDAWRAAPDQHPEPKLVFLGDYVDRGMYSYEGVLRCALSLLLHAPEQVYLLRGNHEHYRLLRGKVSGVVSPAEAIDVHGKLLPQTTLVAYKELFESLPSVLLWGRVVLAHAGIPRDSLLEERWIDLATFNDPGVRFEMAWSDPSSADHVPVVLQKRTSRFPFGRRQLHRFLARIGANVLVRGHEVVENGFRTMYDDGKALLLNVFSAGGANNDDLPPGAPYRRVSPAALTMRSDGQSIVATPWKIDYEPYVMAGGNCFYAPLPYPGLD